MVHLPVDAVMMERDGLQLSPRWRMWMLFVYTWTHSYTHSSSEHEKAVMVSHTSTVRWDREVLAWGQQHSVKVVMHICGRGVTNGCNLEETHVWHQERDLVANSLVELLARR